ncbi:endoprotease [Maridesulfovibrio hydrothermalis]|uniref:Endoprotease n=1 Tax=Maridesulfovibrio hydrothermalis AM13 = DSM 14728 TaxID=1121451 RepID=L0RHP6_9BACT|nr:endoprotease [Maridesulfovibrio hydrothermalis]CCO25106.1 Endoprotease [Maridesulfovibrio hydrothermalis AM13 = DSM 14728]
MSDFPGPDNSQSDHHDSKPANNSEVAQAVLGGEDFIEEGASAVSGAVNIDIDAADQKGVNQAEEDRSVGPDAYELDYGQPDGIDPYVDQQFREFAHEHGIDGNLAQKLVDFNNKLDSARMQEHEIQTQAWEKQTRSLPGWQGNNYRQNMSVANKALQAFASPDLANMIKSAGYSCHPEVVKTFYNIGMRLSEDSYVDSSKNTPRKKTIGEILYPDQPV